MSKSTWANTPPTISKDMVGFVYEITEIKTGMKYIGIKKFWTKRGKKTQWETYISSSAKLKGMDINNPRKFIKAIKKVCYSITELKLEEAWLQMLYYKSGQWNDLYNEMINLRLRIRK